MGKHLETLPLTIFPVRHHLIVLAFTMAASSAAPEDAPLVIFDRGAARVYLDVPEDEAHALRIGPAIDDLADCFKGMTGVPLARRGGTVQLFDPTHEQATRFECAIKSIRDASRHSNNNAEAALVLGPTPRFERGPFAGPGEKVRWSVMWHRGGRRLVFRLTVANQPYYGPGYGPFTFTQMQASAPRFDAGGSVRIALEMRNHADGCLRGAYKVGDAAWVYTDWFDPTKAGTDTRAPGKSDKNGPQAWKEDWPKRWANATAFYVTAYAPKGRQATIVIGDVRVARGGRVAFASGFEDGRLGPWSVNPGQGSARAENRAALLSPQPGGWHTVGLRAQDPGPASFAGRTPLRAELRDYPKGVSRFDARTVQGFEIHASEKQIVLRACTRLGLQNAVYYMLNHWGCRWVMTGELGRCIPRRERLTLPRGVTRFAPRSDVSVEIGPRTAWRRGNLAGWENWLSGQHYWLYAIPPDNNFKTHPEWFSLVGGRRAPRQLCTTAPETIGRMIVRAKRFLRDAATRVSFPMDPMDNIDFCQCAACRAIDSPSAAANGVPSMTDRVVRFANAVAAGIRSEFPDRYVAYYSYSTHSPLPVHARPADNVIVIVCRSGRCLLHLTPNSQCPTSHFHDFVRRWRELTPNIYCYEYDPISWTGGLPCPTYFEMARSLKHLLTVVGIKGSYSDGGDRPAAYASTYINRYMARRMKMDPTQAPGEVLRDMCQSFFGPGAEPMERYYRTLAEVAQYTHKGRARVGGGTTYYHELFSPDLVRRARQHLDRALALAAGQEPYRRRAEMVDMSQRYLEAYLAGVWNAQKRQYNASVAAFDRMGKIIDELAQHGFANATDARRRAKTMRMKALAEHFPKKLGFVTRWQLLGPFDNTDRNAHLSQDRFEPLAAIDRPVVLRTGAQARWWPYESPGGFLNLERAFAGKTGDWDLSYAYAGTTYVAPRAMIAELRMDSFFPFRVFLNGKEVYRRLGLDADCPDKRSVEVKLRAGKNVVVFKLSQTVVSTATYPWGLYFRVVIDETRADAATFPAKWAFRLDPRAVGEKEGWSAADLDDSAWRRIAVPSWWERTPVGQYDGTAWYRVRFTVPRKLAGKRLALKFRGVDEQAWVYLNGQYLGERTVASTGRSFAEFWDEPFEIPVPADRVRYGAPNVLAVRVHDSKYAGGIFKSVRLLVDE